MQKNNGSTKLVFVVCGAAFCGFQIIGSGYTQQTAKNDFLEQYCLHKKRCKKCGQKPGFSPKLKYSNHRETETVLPDCEKKEKRVKVNKYSK